MKDEFFVVLKNSHGSDYALFWRAKHAGYTHILEAAGRYSKAEAERICGIRGEEFMVPCSFVEAKAVSVVDQTTLHIWAAEQESVR